MKGLKNEILIYNGAGFSFGFLSYLLLRKDPVYIPGDPVPYEVIVEVPAPDEVVKPVIVHDTILVTLYDTILIKDIDTVFIVGDYFTAKHYNDTLLNSEDAFIRLEETIYMNAIFNRKLFFQNKRAVTPETFLAVGGSFGNQNATAGLILGKKQGVYSFGVGYGPKPFVQVGYYRKIK